MNIVIYAISIFLAVLAVAIIIYDYKNTVRYYKSQHSSFQSEDISYKNAKQAISNRDPILQYKDRTIHLLELDDKAVLIGRSSLCDICLESEKVSRKHARISFINNNWIILDEKTSNGTYKNKERIPNDFPIVLNDSDIVRLGDTSFIMKINDQNNLEMLATNVKKVA